MGDLLTRRSTSDAVFYGDYLVTATSNLQSTVSLSSEKAEYYACVQGAALALGFRSVLRDWHLDARIELATDSVVAKGFASRRGVGRVRVDAGAGVDTRVVDGEDVDRRESGGRPHEAHGGSALNGFVRSMGMEFRESRAVSQKGTLISEVKGLRSRAVP